MRKETDDFMHPVSSALLDWYDLNARVLPWRGIHDAYRTWVSEAMLQQTRVETVLSYYERFLSRFPDLPSLASAEEADVLKMWEGLGYYSRARNLWNGAKKVMAEYGGILPRNPVELRTIPGIGPYMAGAIASIAFELPVPAVDGNVIRVISRLFDIRENTTRPDIRREIEHLAASLVSSERPGDHNQAMMDLGATVCVPGTPDCDRCPVFAFCQAFAKGHPESLPVIPGSKPPKYIPWTVLVIRSGNRVLLRRRTEKLLQGLWCFPMLEGHLANDELTYAVKQHLGLDTIPAEDHGSARHVFTHQVWDMHLYSMTALPDISAPAGYEWIVISGLSKIALPAAMTAAKRAVG